MRILKLQILKSCNFFCEIKKLERLVMSATWNLPISPLPITKITSACAEILSEAAPMILVFTTQA